MIRSIEARLPGIVITGVGVVFCVGAVSYKVVSDGRMGPGLMPMIAGLALVIIGLMLTFARPDSDSHAVVIQDDREVSGGDGLAVTPTGGENPEGGREETVPPAEKQDQRRPWLILAVTVGALLVTPYIGLIPSLALMALILMRFVEREPWRISLVMTLALLLFAWLIFEEFLNVTLPWGVFRGLV